MQSAEIRETFLAFFKSKGHEIVPSAPMVIKEDPTLMFTNAGMNQFKDVFLGNTKPKNLRVADTQKCLRVSGKHNDLEEVGVDTYHHTMFEMLGNWSFGDYFKKDAIAWAFELLVEVYNLDKDRLYVTYFGGDAADNLKPDHEARDFWKKYFPEERILGFGRKDNFWEMGDTGPCGPCSEIHIDLRSQEEIDAVPGKDLVNKSHPLVVEIWNLVFIEFNRNKDQSLSPLPQKHVDTGMGLERLAMALQHKKSNYDADTFMSLIKGLEGIVGKSYAHGDTKPDVAFRVVVDHLRAVSFAVAEGQLPSNTGAGYVIRRILRRAIRYAYSFLDARQPVICELVPYLVRQMGDVFPELKSQSDLVYKVIHEEEEGFLRTLEKGIERFEKYITQNKEIKSVDGAFAFELYDTYGFPVDLTDLLAYEAGMGPVDKQKFNDLLAEQKNRSRAATKLDAGDWTVLLEDDLEEFVGYDKTEVEVRLVKYRQVLQAKKEFYQLVFNLTPFYPEGGGQVGDTGVLISGEEKIAVIDTRKENNLILHITTSLPKDLNASLTLKVNTGKRINAARNHSATHLLHRALREILGTHVEQKGSLVHPDYLRFDFSHFEKIPAEQLAEIERRVNEDIHHGLKLEEFRDLPLKDAREMGAMALFGEKYGDVVRVIKFGESIELCGGTHVKNTSDIGAFRIRSEASVAAGIRRIEAITGEAYNAYLKGELDLLEEVRSLLKHPENLKVGLKKVLDENESLKKELDGMKSAQLKSLISEYSEKVQKGSGFDFVVGRVDLNGDQLKDLTMRLTAANDLLFAAFAGSVEGKAHLSISIGKQALEAGVPKAKDMIKEISPLIQGGGGGQDHFATAGGKNPAGIDDALNLIREKLKK